MCLVPPIVPRWSLGVVISRFAIQTIILGTAFLTLGILIANFGGIALIGFLALIPLARYRNKNFESTTHGSARLTTTTELKSAGMIDGSNGLVLCRHTRSEPVPLGQALDAILTYPFSRSGEAMELMHAACSKSKTGSLVRAKRFVHTLVCAGSGAGKGIGFIVPNLLEQRHSVICLDIKGENTALTARHREQFGPVHLFDPWGIVNGRTSDCFNPLDMLGHPESPAYLDNCRTIAEAIIEVSPEDREVHFSHMAVTVLQAFIAFVGAHGKEGEKNLNTVKMLLAGQTRFQKTLERMAESNACRGILRHLAAELSAPGEKERGSILTTVSRNLAAFTSPVVADHLSCSTFDYLDLIDGNTPVSLYWCIPANRLGSHKQLARIWISCLLLRIMQRPPSETKKIFLILDEVSQLGALPILEQAITLTRGWGLRIVLVVQSLQQLEKAFPDGADTVLNNCGTQLFFGIRDVKTAELISRRIGQSTVQSGSYQVGDSGSSGTTYGNDVSQSQTSSWSTSQTSAEQGRALIQDSEITRLPNEVCIAFSEDVEFPIVGQRLTYFREPEYAHPAAKTSINQPRQFDGVHQNRRRVVGLLITGLILLGIWRLTEYRSKQFQQQIETPAQLGAETHRGANPASNPVPIRKGPPP